MVGLIHRPKKRFVLGQPYSAGPSDPLFQVFDFTTLPGIDNLDPILDINSQQIAPFMRYKGNDANITNWSVWTYGTPLNLAGGAGTPVEFNKGSPFLGTNDDSVKIAIAPPAAQYYRAPNTTYGNLGTDDFVVEMVWRCDKNAAHAFIEKGLPGFTFNLAAGPTLFYQLNDGVNSVNNALSTVVSAGTWSHIIFFVDRQNGQLKSYQNGFGATIKDISIVTGSLSSATTFWILGNTISYLAFWKANNWLGSVVQDDLVIERYQKLAGIYPTFAEKPARIYTGGYFRSAPGYTRIDDQLYNMSNYSARYEKTSEVFGYLSEVQSTNDFDYSEDLSQWTPNQVTIDTTGITALDDSKIMEGIIANVTDTQHYISKSLSPAATVTHMFSAFVKKGTQDWCYLRSAVAGPLIITQWFNLDTGSIGTSSGTILNKGIEDWGNGYYRIWMEYDGPAALHNHIIGAANADNDDDFSDASGNAALYVWGLQHEEDIKYPTSYIESRFAASTRIRDALLFEAGDNIGGADNQRGRIDCNVLIPNHDNEDELTIAHIDQDPVTATDYIGIFVDSVNDQLSTRTRKTAGNAGDSAVIGDVSNGTKHQTITQWRNNNLKNTLDATVGTADTTCDMPTGLDDITIGCDDDRLFQLNGVIEDFKIYGS